MNQTMETILARRSVRSFRNQPIPQEELEQIVQAALHAPSAMGRQTWKFTVVTNREKIQKLAQAVAEVLGREGYDMYQPETIIIPSNERTSKFGKEDDACAMMNIFLAAKSFGIGSVWINQLQGICDDPKIREVLREFEIPEDHVVYGLAALGYPDDTPISEKERIGKVAYIR